MRAKPLRERRAARMETFLDGAMRVVERDGIEGLTVGALADELDVAQGALYRYFPGKDDVLGALQARALGALSTELTAAADAAVGDRGAPLAIVVDLLAVVATLPERDPPRYRLLDELLSAPAPVYAAARARTLETHLEKTLGVVEKALTNAAAKRALTQGNAALRTRVLWACLHGAAHLRKRDRLEPNALRQREVERAALEALLVGFGAKRAKVTAALRSWPRRRRT